MNSSGQFNPWQSLVPGEAHPQCRASVIVPARNEEASLGTTLDSLANQRNSMGGPLDPLSFEVLLLLNNCTDESAVTANRWAECHPETALHVIERQLPTDIAHVGTARRWLMDTAWHRLTCRSQNGCPSISGILSTDSDTIVQPDWIFQNLKTLEEGADAVGGNIILKDEELQTLPHGARNGYLNDRTYQSLVARLEDLLDPQNGDPWPRHLQHFGASLACTPEAYAKSGGMPAVQPLEDVAFVDALRSQGAKLRHATSVLVSTSARFDGRAQIGLSFQLREWQRLYDQNEKHLVPSARWLVHRFGIMSLLRHFYRSFETSLGGKFQPDALERLVESREHSSSLERFLAHINCDRLIEESFHLERQQPIKAANQLLSEIIHQRLTDAPS